MEGGSEIANSKTSINVSSQSSSIFLKMNKEGFQSYPAARKVSLPKIQKYEEDEAKKRQLAKVPVKMYKFYVGPGNNASLVRRILSTRKNWEQVEDSKSLFLNFRWQQTNSGFKYDNCANHKVLKYALNHLQFHQELSNKELLFKNLQQYCESNKLKVLDYVPMTFVLNLSNNNFEKSHSEFMNMFEAFMPHEMKEHTPNRKFALSLVRRRSGVNFLNPRDTSCSPTKQSKKPTSPIVEQKKYEIMKESFMDYEDSQYLWILKPTMYNRGSGIHVFNSIAQLEKLMNCYICGESPFSESSESSLCKTISGSEAKMLNNQSEVIVKQRNKAMVSTLSSNRETSSLYKTNQSVKGSEKTKSFRISQSSQQSKPITSFVIQKYLQLPLLYENRKFDLRLWVLFTQDARVYMFKQGYMRTSSTPYSNDSKNLGNNNVHLTNNTIQKHNRDGYGKFEDGNQLSFKVLKALIEKRGKSYTETMSQIKHIIKLTFLAVKKKINKFLRMNCFEIFGYDFMLDQNCRPWLIEVNTNPCLEESSLLLEGILPRMLDDAFTLTLDSIFETEKKGYNYSLENEYSTDNLWQLIVDLKKTSNFAGKEDSSEAQLRQTQPNFKNKGNAVSILLGKSTEEINKR